MRRMPAVLAGMVVTLAMIVWAAPVSAGNGAQVFSSGTGGWGSGSGRTDGTGRECLGFQPSDDLGLTFVSHVGAKLTVTSSGNAQVAFHADESYAFYANPGDDLPHPGDPGWSWSGSVVVKDYSTTVSSLVPDQNGTQFIPISVPFVMTSPDGSTSQVMYLDYAVVIVFSGNQVIGVGTYEVGPRCP